MNQFDFTGLGLAIDLLVMGGVILFSVGTTMGGSYAARRMRERHMRQSLEGLARDLGLTVDGQAMRGSRDGILVIMEPVGEYNEQPMFCIRLLDPKGPGGVDFVADQSLAHASGPDLIVGDAAFDAAVHVSAADPLHALAALPGTARELVAEGVRLGWRRVGAEWIRDRIGVDEEAMQFELRRGLRLCMALRFSGASAAERVRIRMEDADRGVATVAARLLLERKLLDADGLRRLLDVGRPDVAVEASKQLGAEGRAWLQEAVVTGKRETRLRAAIELARVMAEPPLTVEPVLLRGLDGPLRAEVLEALGHVGSASALRAIEGAPDAADAVRRITERRAQFAGGLSLVDSAGGEVSIVDPPPSRGGDCGQE